MEALQKLAVEVPFGVKPQLTTVRKFTDSLVFMNLPVLKYIDREDFAIVKIEELGMQLPYQTPVFRPDHYSIIVVPEGSATYLIDDKVFELGPDTILFSRPDVFLSFTWLNVGTAYTITFTKQFLMQYWPAGIDEIQKLDSAKGYATGITAEMMKTSEGICHNMYKEAISSAPYKYEVISNHILNLLLLIRQQQYTQGTKTSKEKNNFYVEAFISHMDENFSKIISGETTVLFSIKDYAEMQNLNNNYLSKIVSTITGKTVNQWIHERLIGEIKYLLKYTDKPMMDIAMLYGFNDLNYFYNFFKRHTKNAPGYFRKDFNRYGNKETETFYGYKQANA